MEKILGIDTGTNSLGWAIVNKNSEGKYNLIERGVSIFQEGVKIDKGIESSKAADKTSHKSQRVGYYRRKLRKIRLIKVLSDAHLCPAVSSMELYHWRTANCYPENLDFREWQLTGDEQHNPFYFRYKCLTEKFDLAVQANRYLLGRALYHINQRRGFLSNRKTQDNEEEGKVKTSISRLSEDMSETGCAYLGEYYYKLYLEGKKIRNHYTSREEHYLAEFHAICDKQCLDQALVNKLEHAIFFQRPLKSQKGLVGHCLFEPKKTKCPSSHPLFEEFRMWAFVNNIKMQTPADSELRFLSKGEKNRILSKFYRKSKPQFTFEDIAKELAGARNYAYYKKPQGKPYLFNYQMDTSVSGCPVTAGLRDIFGEEWLSAICEVYDKGSDKTEIQVLNDIWHVLFDFSDKEHLVGFAKQHLQLNDENAKKFANIKVNSAYAALSLKAIKNILPYLRRGMIYSHAVFMGKLCDIVPNEIWSDEEQWNTIIADIIEEINANERGVADVRTPAQCIKDYLIYKFHLPEKTVELLYHPSMMESYAKVPDNQNQLGSPRISSLRNPMAMRSLFSLRHLINTLLREKKIDRNTTIHIEFARELNDANKRQALSAFNKENEKNKVTARKEIESLFKTEYGQDIEVTDTDVLKYQLWEEQKHKCIYTGEEICLTDFLGPNPKYDIEHTIPRSVGGDSTKMNLTLCNSRFNRDVKRTLLPSQLQNHESILLRIKEWKEKFEDLQKRIRKIRTSPSMSKEQKDRLIQKRCLLQLECDYWYGKYHRFEMTTVPEGFSRRQGTDISVISKYGRLYLKSFFDRVFIVKGLATSDFRKIWGIQNIYEKKARVNHVHHCIDAIVIACIGPYEYSKLANYYHDKENSKWYGLSKPHFDKPWDSFTADLKDIQNEIIVSHHSTDNMSKQGRRRILINGKKVLACGDSARTSLHNETYYGAIERDGQVKYVVRKTLDATFKESDVKNIVDDSVRAKVEEAIQRYGFKEALAGTIWMSEEKGIPIHKVRCYTPTVTRPLNIRLHRDLSPKEYKQQYHVTNDTNYAMALYIGQNDRGKEKRLFNIVNNLQASAYYKISNKGNDEHFGLVPLSKDDYPLAYVLKKGTLVLLYEESKEELYNADKKELVKRLYKITGLSQTIITGNEYGVITMLHAQEARPAKEIKAKNGAFKIGEDYRPSIVMYHTQIKALCEGVDFDINNLGDITFKS